MDEAMKAGIDLQCARRGHRLAGDAHFSGQLRITTPMLTQIGMALVISLVLASDPVALAHDTAWPRPATSTGATVVDRPSAQTHRFEVSRTAWPAPVGHRQPRAEDIPAEGLKKRDSDVQLERLDGLLDDKLMICRRC
jgi:hypothetical protein